jgi:hypothetical protein
MDIKRWFRSCAGLHVGDFADTLTVEVRLSALVLRVGDLEVGPSNSNVMLDVYLFSMNQECWQVDIATNGRMIF